MDGEIVEGELLDAAGEPVGPVLDVPPRKELILRGRASLADLEYNPDATIPADVLEMMTEAANPNTEASYAYWWGFWINACDAAGGRQHCPATRQTAITVLWRMAKARNAKGELRGWKGQPYSPRTVAHLMYVVSAVHQRKGWGSPTWDKRKPTVADELEKYERWYDRKGYQSREANALSYEDAVTLARACDLSTVQGLRMATALRLADDTGMRISEWQGLNVEDVTFPEPGVMRVRIGQSKQSSKPRTVLVEEILDVDGDVDPVVLMRTLIASRVESGAGPKDPIFCEVAPAPRRSDGQMAGRWLPGRWQRGPATSALDRLLAKVPQVRMDPHTKVPRHITWHTPRHSLITRSVWEGIPREVVAARTGHSLASPSFNRYFDTGDQRGRGNAGGEIRRRRRKKAEDD